MPPKFSFPFLNIYADSIGVLQQCGMSCLGAVGGVSALCKSM